MIVIETCPKCGHDLRDEVICTNYYKYYDRKY